MLWIALCLPQLPLEIWADDAQQPLAIADSRSILFANSSARAAGVRVGLKRSSAVALCPALVLRTRRLQQEQQALEALASWALRFTPSVSLLSPSSDQQQENLAGLLLEVAGSLRLFGGLQALLKQVCDGLQRQGHQVHWAAAPVAQAAWILARASSGTIVQDHEQLITQLAPQPAWLLKAGRTHWSALQSVGVNCLADLLRLPRASVARRFSPDLLDELDRALARKPDPRVWFVAPAVFETQLELAARVEQADALLFAARRLLTQVAGWLIARQSGTRQLKFALHHEDRPVTALLLQLADASCDESRFTALLREVLARTQLPAPVYELALRCDDCLPLSADSAHLFPAPRSTQEGLARLIERLQARLGQEQVLQFCLQPDHRPERAFTTQIARPQSTANQRAGRVSRAGANAVNHTSAQALFTANNRPLWLLAKPLPLTEQNDLPIYKGPLQLLAGPERIESGWWDHAWVARDYFIAQNKDAAVLWIYRLRLADVNSHGGWFLHGRFG